MRFFSNEAKENTDVTDDAEAESPGHVESDAVTVPHQRAGSPWSDAPGSSDTATHSADSSDFSDSADGELADQERRDGTDESLRTDDSQLRHDGDDLVPDADAPAAEAGTAEPSDHPVDLPLDDRHETGAETGESTTTTYGPDGTVRTDDEPAAETDASTSDVVAEDTADATETDVAAAGDEATAEDAAPADEGGFDSPAVVEPAAVEPVDVVETVDDRDLNGAGPAVVEEDVVAVAAIPVATVPDEETAADQDADVAVPVASTATPTGDKPGSVAAPGLDQLFPDGDSFVDRFREIQLRFVDGPREATADAATLIDEAIDKLATALKAQKDGLAGDSDDTEQLRVTLRAYRDILNRLTAL